MKSPKSGWKGCGEAESQGEERDGVGSEGGEREKRTRRERGRAKERRGAGEESRGGGCRSETVRSETVVGVERPDVGRREEKGAAREEQKKGAKDERGQSQQCIRVKKKKERKKKRECLGNSTEKREGNSGSEHPQQNVEGFAALFSFLLYFFNSSLRVFGRDAGTQGRS